MNETTYKITITTSKIWVHSGPAMKYKLLRVLNKNDIVYSKELDGTWFKLIDGGWISTYDNNSDDPLFTVEIEDVDIPQPTILPCTPILKHAIANMQKQNEKQVEEHEKELKAAEEKKAAEAKAAEEKKTQIGQEQQAAADAKKSKVDVNDIKQTEEEYKEMLHERGSFSDNLTNGLYGDNGAEFIKSARGIHGMPYQYLPTVDRRLPGSLFGRKYAEKIVARLPILLLSPGRPKFMKDYSKKDKSTLLKSLIKDDESIVNKVINDKDGKLYSFEYRYASYYKIVNKMCSILSTYLNIQNVKLPFPPSKGQYYASDDKKEQGGQTCGTFCWESFTDPAFKTMLTSKESIAFYVDSDTQISESFNNAVAESMLANKINEVSDMGQELQFLLGGVAGTTGKRFDKFKAENYDATMKEFTNFTDKYKSFLPKNLMDSLSSGLLTVFGGGKMMFPEIWKDSNYSTSYSITVKLRCPAGDNLSWFLDIGVPLMHLIAFTAPQQMGANGYRAPFLVRGYYKSFFNCQMGLITSMNISRGEKSRWTQNGLPTEVDVSFDIKDLYDVMAVSLFDKSKISSFSNPAMLNYIANLAGVNINKPDVRRMFDLFMLDVENKGKDIITLNRFNGVQQAVTNLVNTLFKN